MEDRSRTDNFHVWFRGSDMFHHATFLTDSRRLNNPQRNSDVTFSEFTFNFHNLQLTNKH